MPKIKIQEKIQSFYFVKQMVRCKSTAKEVSFEWSHHRILSADLKVRNTLHVPIIDSWNKRAIESAPRQAIFQLSDLRNLSRSVAWCLLAVSFQYFGVKCCFISSQETSCLLFLSGQELLNVVVHS